MQTSQLAVSHPVGAPDSELCQRATALVAELSPPFLFNHCVRSFLFGDAIGKRDGLKYDRSSETVAQIVREYPRPDFISSATNLLVRCAQRKPQFVPGTFLEMVVHSHAPDVRVPTYADLLAQSPWKE